MNIKQVHIASKRRVGSLHGQPVVEILLKGGLCLVTTLKNGKPCTIGAGPHVGVARWMAEKNEPDCQLTELSKSETITPAGYASVEAEYQQLVQNWNAAFSQLPE